MAQRHCSVDALLGILPPLTPEPAKFHPVIDSMGDRSGIFRREILQARDRALFFDRNDVAPIFELLSGQPCTIGESCVLVRPRVQVFQFLCNSLRNVSFGRRQLKQNKSSYLSHAKCAVIMGSVAVTNWLGSFVAKNGITKPD